MAWCITYTEAFYQSMHVISINEDEEGQIEEGQEEEREGGGK